MVAHYIEKCHKIGIFQENENVTSQASASSFASAGTQQSEDRSTSSQSGGGNNTSGFFLSGPGNVEIYMDFGPQGVALGSVEATIIPGSESRNPRQNIESGIQLGNLGEFFLNEFEFEFFKLYTDELGLLSHT